MMKAKLVAAMVAFCILGTTFNVVAQGGATPCVEVPEFTIHPLPIVVCKTDSKTNVPTEVKLSASAMSSDASSTITYAWQIHDGANWVDISMGTSNSGATWSQDPAKTNEINIQNVTDSDFFNNRPIRCLATNSCGTTPSLPSAVTVNSEVSFDANPQSLFICIGAKIELWVGASGGGPYDYEWFRNGAPVPLGAATNPITINGPTLTKEKAEVTDAGSYTVRVTNACGAKTSDAANILISQPATIAVQPVDATVCASGGNGSFQIGINAGGQVDRYTWQYQLPTAGAWADVTDGVFPPGTANATARASAVNTNTLLLSNLETVNDKTKFRCTIISNCPGAAPSTSSEASLFVDTRIDAKKVKLTAMDNLAPMPHPDVDTLYIRCVGLGGETSLEIGNTTPGTTFSSRPVSTLYQPYAWYKDGNKINQANSSTYSIAAAGALQVSDAGLYEAEISNACGVVRVFSRLVVNTIPIIDQIGDQRVCNSRSYAFQTKVSGGGPYSYTWYRDGTPTEQSVSAGAITSPIPFKPLPVGKLVLDIVDGHSTVGYSLRRLRESYKGPLVQLTNGIVTQDIGFDENGALDIADFNAKFPGGTAGVTVSKWYNQNRDNAVVAPGVPEQLIVSKGSIIPPGGVSIGETTLASIQDSELRILTGYISTQSAGNSPRWPIQGISSVITRTSNAAGAISSIEFWVLNYDGTYTRGVKIRLTQRGTRVYADMISNGYAAGNQLNSDFDVTLTDDAGLYNCTSCVGYGIFSMNIETTAPSDAGNSSDAVQPTRANQPEFRITGSGPEVVFSSGKYLKVDRNLAGLLGDRERVGAVFLVAQPAAGSTALFGTTNWSANLSPSMASFTVAASAPTAVVTLNRPASAVFNQYSFLRTTKDVSIRTNYNETNSTTAATLGVAAAASEFIIGAVGGLPGSSPTGQFLGGMKEFVMYNNPNLQPRDIYSLEVSQRVSYGIETNPFTIDRDVILAADYPINFPTVVSNGLANLTPIPTRRFKTSMFPGVDVTRLPGGIIVRNKTIPEVLTPASRAAMTLWIDGRDRRTIHTGNTATSPEANIGDQINFWQDKSGNDNNMVLGPTPMTPPTRTANGVHFLYYAGSPGGIQGMDSQKAPWTNVNEMEGFFVQTSITNPIRGELLDNLLYSVNPVPPLHERTSIYSGWHGSQVVNARIGIGDPYGGPAGLGFFDVRADPSSRVITSVPDLPFLLAVWNNASTNIPTENIFSLRVNGEGINNPQPNSGIPASPRLANGILRIAGHLTPISGSNPDQEVDAETIEVILFNRSLTAAEREDVEGVLAWGNNIQYRLIPGHKYSAEPPVVWDEESIDRDYRVEVTNLCVASSVPISPVSSNTAKLTVNTNSCDVVIPTSGQPQNAYVCEGTSSLKNPWNYRNFSNLSSSSRATSWVGTLFSTNTSKTIVSLGAFFAAGQTNTRPRRVALWNRNGQLLADATIPVNTTGNDEYVYAKLAVPITIPAGTYTVGAQTGGAFTRYYSRSNADITNSISGLTPIRGLYDYSFTGDVIRRPIYNGGTTSQTLLIGSVQTDELQTSFEVKPTGVDASTTYQWQYRTSGTNDPWVNVPSGFSGGLGRNLTYSGQNQSVLQVTTINVNRYSNAGPSFEYRCVINGGAITSGAAQLIVSKTATLKPQRTPESACSGGSLILNAELDPMLSGSGPYSFTWKKGNTVVRTVSDVQQAADTYTESNLLSDATYTVEASSVCPVGERGTSTVQVIVSSDFPTITLHPSDLDICAKPQSSTQPQTGTFEVSTSSIAASIDWEQYIPREKVWRSLNDKSTTKTEYQGSLDPHFKDIDKLNMVVSVTQYDRFGYDGRYYRAKVYNACGAAYSNAAILRIRTADPQSVNLPAKIGTCVAPGQTTIDLRVQAASPDASTFQWQILSPSAAAYQNLVDDTEIQGVITNTLHFIGSPTAANVQAGNKYRCLISNGCNSTIAGPFELEVFPGTPTVSSLPDQTRCSGDLTDLISFDAGSTQNPGVITYLWHNDQNPETRLPRNGNRAIHPFGVINFRQIPVDDEIRVTPAVLGCLGKEEAVVKITVNPAPTLSLTSDALEFCGGKSFQLSMNPAPLNIQNTTFRIDAVNINPPGKVSGYAPTGIVTSPPDAEGVVKLNQVLQSLDVEDAEVVYRVTPEAATCVGASRTVKVKVNSIPVMDSINVTDAQLTLCEQDNLPNILFTSNYTAKRPNDVTYNWDNDNPGIGLPSIGRGDITKVSDLQNQTTVPLTAIVSVTPQSANGCIGDPLRFTVIVKPVPTIKILNTTATICSGSVAKIELSTLRENVANTKVEVAGITFPTGLTPDVPIVPNTQLPGFTLEQKLTLDPAISDAQVARYTFQATADGCSGNLESAEITVSPNPVLTGLPTAPISVCSGEAANIPLPKNSAKDVYYTWTVDSPQYGARPQEYPRIGNIIDVLNLPTGATAPATVIYTVKPEANNCFGNEGTITVTVNPLPIATAVSNSNNFCSGGQTSIDITSSINPSTFFWEVESVGVGGASPQAKPGVSGPIQQTLTNLTAFAGKVTYKIFAIANGCQSLSPAESVVTTVRGAVITKNLSATTPYCDDSSLDIGVEVDYDRSAPSYQWEVSTNEGVSWTQLTDTPPYVGAQTSSLHITSTPTTYERYQYRLTVKDNICSQFTSAPTTIMPFFTNASINVSNLTPNYGDDVSFTFVAPNAQLPANTVYKWNFGDGWTSDEETTTHYFYPEPNNQGPFTPTLVVNTDEYGCKKIFTGSPISVNGRKDVVITADPLMTEGVAAYPTPFKDRLTLRSTIPIVELVLYDEIGKSTIRSSYGGVLETSFSTADLSSGVYIVRLTLEGGKTKHLKVIKK